MSFLDFAKKKKEVEERGIGEALFYNSSTFYSTNKAMLLSAVYRCVDVISDSVAQLPMETFYVDDKGFKRKYTEHPAYYIIAKEPNRKMTRFTFIKTLIVSMLLKGNGFAYINRKPNGEVISFELIDANKVQIVEHTDGTIAYSVVGYDKEIEPFNMLHLINFTYDGIHGVSTLDHARNSLGLALDSESHARGFFKGGANVAGILKILSSVTAKQKDAIKDAWGKAFSPSEGKPNSIAVLEGNMEFTPVSISPADSQLLQTREFNVIDICRFFSISPVKCFDLSKSSYSTVEATQLAFLTDTLAPLLEKIESEYERKVFMPNERMHIDVKFDTSMILRADKAAMASYLNTLFQMGTLTPNEARMILDLPSIEHGDDTFTQVNVQPLKKHYEKSED